MPPYLYALFHMIVFSSGYSVVFHFFQVYALFALFLSLSLIEASEILAKQCQNENISWRKRDGQTDRQTDRHLKQDTGSEHYTYRQRFGSRPSLCSAQIQSLVLNVQCKVLSTVVLSNLFVLSTVPPPFYLDRQTDRHIHTYTHSN